MTTQHPVATQIAFDLLNHDSLQTLGDAAGIADEAGNSRVFIRALMTLCLVEKTPVDRPEQIASSPEDPPCRQPNKVDTEDF